MAYNAEYQRKYSADHREHISTRQKEWYMNKLEPLVFRKIRKAVRNKRIDPLTGLILAILAQAVVDNDTEWLDTTGQDIRSILVNKPIEIA